MSNKVTNVILSLSNSAIGNKLGTSEQCSTTNSDGSEFVSRYLKDK